MFRLYIYIYVYIHIYVLVCIETHMFTGHFINKYPYTRINIVHTCRVHYLLVYPYVIYITVLMMHIILVNIVDDRGSIESWARGKRVPLPTKI